MVTYWNIDLADLRYLTEPSVSSEDDPSAVAARGLFERGMASAEGLGSTAWVPSEITDEDDRLVWAASTGLSHESTWSAYQNAGWCASGNVGRKTLERLADTDPTLVINAPGVPPHLVDRAARRLLAAAKFVRVRRLAELGIELTDAEEETLSTFDADQPWFADHAESPSVTGYVLDFHPRSSSDELRRHNQAIDEFLDPIGLPDGYVTRVIQLKQGLIARAFVPEGSAWALGEDPGGRDEAVPWSTGSVDRQVCVVVRPRGLTDGTVGLDQPAEGVPERLRRWNGEGGEGMVVEVLPVWGEYSWESVDAAGPGGLSPMTDGQVDGLMDLCVLLRIYANPRHATMLSFDSANYLAIRHAATGTLFDPVLLAGGPPGDELVASRAAWFVQRGLRMPAYDLRHGPTSVDALLALPFAAQRIPDPPSTRLSGKRSDTWNLTGDRVVDAGLRRGQMDARQIMLYAPDVTTPEDVERAFRALLDPSHPPDTVERYARLVGAYLNTPRALRERLGPLQLLQEPADAHATTVRGLNARHYATVRALLAAEASFDLRHVHQASEVAARHPELASKDVAVDPRILARDVAQLRADLERIEEFLRPQGVGDDELARLLVVDCDLTDGTGLRLWRGESTGDRARVLVGVPDPAMPGHAERVGQVSTTLLDVLGANREVTVAESWNSVAGLQSTLPTALYYLHTHVGPLERVFAEGSTGPVASRAYPRETRTVEPPWETHLGPHLATAGQNPSPGPARPMKPRRRRDR